LPQRVAVSRDGAHVFVYADDGSAAQAARRELSILAPTASTRLDRWHHEEERWEDAAAPDNPEVEHARREAEETAESQESGLAEWEVRVDFASHHDAKEFAEQEQSEGQAITRRWKYVLIGLNDQDDAEALARRLQSQLPEGARLHVEPGSGLAWEVRPRNPFAVFGGLGE
jgi:hypothetical protein